ncbi:hypothetical protein QP157_21190 [Sphingomonas sp. LR61]
MTTVRGMIRSTNTITADGLADDQSTARARAVASRSSTGTRCNNTHDPRTGYISHNKYYDAVTGYGVPISSS